MCAFLLRYGINISKTTIHKYINKDLKLSAVIMHKRPCYTVAKKHQIFDDLLNQNFTVDKKNKVWCTGFTYIRQSNGKLRYNCSIIDLHDSTAMAVQ